VGGVMLALCSTCEEAEIGWGNESMMIKKYISQLKTIEIATVVYSLNESILLGISRCP